MKIIFNEKEFIENFIKNGTKKDVGYGKDKVTVTTLILMLTKYYYSENENETYKSVSNYMDSLKIDRFADYDKIILSSYNICKSMGYKLKVFNEIPLYKSEYDIINQGENGKEKKLLFTLFILAKYFGNKNGKVPTFITSKKILFDYADINMSIYDRGMMIYKLFKKKLLGQNKINTDLSLYVRLGDESESIVMKVNKFEHLGNQFIAHEKKGYKICEKCGRLIKVVNNKQKYCNRCAKQIEAEQKHNWDKINRSQNLRKIEKLVEP
jgi:hypothetical protein